MLSTATGKTIDGRLDEFAVVLDDETLRCELARDTDLRTLALGEAVTDPPSNVIFVRTRPGDDVGHVQSRTLNDVFAGSRVVYFPVAAFDSSYKAVEYGLGQLLRSSLSTAAAASRDWIDHIESEASTMRYVQGGDSAIESALSESFAASWRGKPTLDPGEWISVGEFFEIELECFRPGESPFTVNGVLRAHALLAAKSAHMDPALVHRHPVAVELVEAIGDGGGLTLEISDNTLVAANFDGDDIASVLIALAGRHYGGCLTEFALGVNQGCANTADWSINSQMNEGAGDLHIGIGDGRTGFHFDFIASDGRWE